MWLQRVQQGAAQAAGKAGPDLPQFLLQIAHAARVLFFQPLLLHAAQVAQYVRSVGAVGSVEPADSMQQAMQYPSDSASDAERVEWLHLNLLIQFQSLYRDVLCNAAVFELHYSNAEAGLFQVDGGQVRKGEIGEAEALIGEVKQLGLYVDLQQQRWHTADGRAGAMEPFTLSRGAETNGSSGPASGVARESGATKSPKARLPEIPRHFLLCLHNPHNPS